MKSKQNERRGLRRLTALLLAAAVLMGAPALSVSAAGFPTSLGLAEHGMKAFRDGWVYAYGGKGEEAGDTRQSDCSGLIYAYFKDMNALGSCQGGVASQVRVNCVYSAPINKGIPRIHGLTVTASGYSHVGIYIGNNEATDNSDYGVNMLWGPVVGSNRGWTNWHVFDNGMRYPSNGWYELDGRMVHYTDCEYDTDQVIDGYTVGSTGFALTDEGTYAPVDGSILSSDYVSAKQVAEHLKSTYGDGHIGPDPDPDPDEYNGKITGDEVRLRSAPGTDSNIVALLNKGVLLNILSEESGETVYADDKVSDVWYKVTTSQGKNGYVSSLFVSKVVAERPDPPMITAKDGQVTMTCATQGAVIYYTVDCSTPSEDSIEYTGPIQMTGCTFKAVAVKKGLASGVISASVMSNCMIFTDLDTTKWYFSAVDQAVNASIFQGFGDGVFGADRVITRAQFVTALANLDRADLSGIEPGTDSGFTDVKVGKDKLTRSVVWAVNAKIINGFPDGSFHPDEKISREQMCVILTRYAGLQPAEELQLFDDDGKIGSWARDAVYACRDNKLVNGIGNNLFDPQGTATRAQACVITGNLFELKKNG